MWKGAMNKAIDFAIKHWYLSSFCLGCAIAILLVFLPIFVVGNDGNPFRARETYSVFTYFCRSALSRESAAPSANCLFFIGIMACVGGLASLVCAIAVRGTASQKDSRHVQFFFLLASSLILWPSLLFIPHMTFSDVPQFSFEELIHLVTSPISRTIARQPKAKVGFVNEKGTVIIAAKFDMAKGFHSGLAKVRVGQKWGYIDRTGKIIIKPQFDYADDFCDGMAVVGSGTHKENNTPNVYIVDAELPATDETGAIASWELPLDQDFAGKKGYIDTRGRLVRAMNFDYAGEYSGGVAVVGVGNGNSRSYSLIDKSGKVVTDQKYDGISTFSEGLAIVMKGRRAGYINSAGKLVIPLSYEQAKPFSEGIATVSLFEPKKVSDDLDVREWSCFIDKTGHRLFGRSFNCTFDGFSEGLACVRDGSNKCWYIDTAGKKVFDFDGHWGEPFYGGVARVTSGYVDKTGKKLTEQEWRAATKMDHDLETPTLSPKRIGSKYGYVDRSGKIVIQPTFDYAYPFSEGLAPIVMLNEN
jgi:hypothetical protein